MIMTIHVIKSTTKVHEVNASIKASNTVMALTSFRGDLTSKSEVY